MLQAGVKEGGKKTYEEERKVLGGCEGKYKERQERRYNRRNGKIGGESGVTQLKDGEMENT